MKLLNLIGKKVLPKAMKYLEKHDKALHSATTSVFGHGRVEAVGDELMRTIESLPTAKVSVGNLELLTEERNFYKTLLNEFKELKPEVRRSCSYTETASKIASHPNGSQSELVADIREEKDGIFRVLREVNPRFTLREYGRELNVDINLRKISGDKDLAEELKFFLKGDIPTVENLDRFMEYRDIEYLKNNGITNFKELRKSLEKGAEISKQEENYHALREAMYTKLWKPLHNEKFYRVIGEDELISVLSGNRIVSATSKARYGRQCVDITRNPYYHNIFYGEQKYRITFKVKDADGGYHTSFTENIHDFNPEKSHYQVPSYCKDDIAELHAWNGEDWIKIGTDGLL